jgi:hypothetical protein
MRGPHIRDASGAFAIWLADRHDSVESNIFTHQLRPVLSINTSIWSRKNEMSSCIEPDYRRPPVTCVNCH